MRYDLNLVAYNDFNPFLMADNNFYIILKLSLDTSHKNKDNAMAGRDP